MATQTPQTNYEVTKLPDGSWLIITSLSAADVLTFDDTAQASPGGGGAGGVASYIGVANADIGSAIGVANADISTINGV